MSKKSPVKIVETVLRDGHQSLIATRMRTDDMLPVLEQLDNIGYYAIEAWGGATFDSCLRFLNEDPWERLRVFKKHLKKTPIQMLLRGQNLLGYNHYADDVVIEFIKRAIYNGVKIIRMFDALNDVRNLKIPMQAAKQFGAHVQSAFVYTISPFHSIENFVKLATELVDLGADSICIKDMAGLLKPFAAYDLIKALKKEIKIPINLHTHYSSGMASMTYLKAIEAGVDIVDCAISPFSMASSQPSTEALVATLEGHERETNIQKENLYPIADYFRTIKKDLIKIFKLETNIEIDTKVLSYQIPGGMLSNLLSQMKEQGMSDKFQELIEEMPRVRAELGYPPLVTPISQIIGSVSAMNIILGRYKVIPNEVKNIVRGEYGCTPTPINPDFYKKILGNEKPIINRPADNILPQMENLKNELCVLGYSNISIEDILSYALFPESALKLFSQRL